MATYISMVLHGTYGVGKTTLANTAPGPRLVIDVEGGSGWVKNVEKVYWTQEQMLLGQLPPEPEGGWAAAKNLTVLVDASDWDTSRMAIDTVLGGGTPFRSVILDSLTEMQRQLKDKINPVHGYDQYNKPTYDVWDQLLVHMERDVRALHSMTREASPHPRFNLFLVVPSDDEMFPRKPLLQGAMRKRLAGFVDMVGYLKIELDEFGRKRRVLQLEQDDVAYAKCRIDQVTEKLGVEVYDPNLKAIIRAAQEDK